MIKTQTTSKVSVVILVAVCCVAVYWFWFRPERLEDVAMAMRQADEIVIWEKGLPWSLLPTPASAPTSLPTPSYWLIKDRKVIEEIADYFFGSGGQRFATRGSTGVLRCSGVIAYSKNSLVGRVFVMDAFGSANSLALFSDSKSRKICGMAYEELDLRMFLHEIIQSYGKEISEEEALSRPK